MKALLISVAGIFAAIPGLLILASGLGVPPGRTGLFGGAIEAFGSLVLLLLWLNAGKLKRMSARAATRSSVVMGISALCVFALYIFLFSLTVQTHAMRGTAYFPLWTTGTLQQMVDRAGSRAAAIERYGIDAVQLAIDQMSPAPLAVTTILMLALYVLAFTLLTAAFGIPGFRITAKQE